MHNGITVLYINEMLHFQSRRVNKNELIPQNIKIFPPQAKMETFKILTNMYAKSKSWSNDYVQDVRLN